MDLVVLGGGVCLIGYRVQWFANSGGESCLQDSYLLIVSDNFKKGILGKLLNKDLHAKSW